MPILIAPIAGLLSDRIGGRPIMATGLALQATGLAWIGAILTTTLPYSSIVIPFALSGIGMAMYFAPVANVVLSSVKPDEEGQASGANNAIRELGGVFGVAVLAAVFSHYGGYQTPDSFVHGVTPALYLGAALVAIGAAAALFIPRRRQPLGRGTADRAQRPRDSSGLARGRCCRDQRDRCVDHGVGHHHSEHAPGSGRARARHPGADRGVPGGHPLDRARRPVSTRARHERSKAPLARHPALVPAGHPGTGSGSRTCRPRSRHSSPASGGLPASIFTRLKLAAISNAVPLSPRRRLARRPVLDRLRNRTAALHRPRRRPRQPRLRGRRDRPPTRRQHRRLPRRPHRLDREGRREQQRHLGRVDRPHRRHPIRARRADASRPRQPNRRVLRNARPRPHRDVRPLPRRRHSGGDDAHRPQDRCRPRHGRLPLRQGRHHRPQEAVHALRRRPRIPAPAEPGPVLEPPDADPATQSTSQAPPTSRSPTSSFSYPSWPARAKRPRKLASDPWSARSTRRSRTQPSAPTSSRSSTGALRGKGPVPTRIGSFPGVRVAGR